MDENIAIYTPQPMKWCPLASADCPIFSQCPRYPVAKYAGVFATYIYLYSSAGSIVFAILRNPFFTRQLWRTRFIELDDGNIYKKPLYLMVKPWFPVNFPLNQSIDRYGPPIWSLMFSGNRRGHLTRRDRPGRWIGLWAFNMRNSDSSQKSDCFIRFHTVWGQFSPIPGD